MHVYLKVKIKSLAAEARIIRLEERKAKVRRKTLLVNELCCHRKLVVRRAAREALIAYGYVRGRAYAAIEQPVRSPVQSHRWKEIAKLASRYGRPTTPEEIEAWARPKKAAAA